MKRIRIAAVLLALSLFLGGCAGIGSDALELLESPRLSQSQTQIVEALNKYVGSTVHLVYPENGDFLSPFMFKDVNGDGVSEAVAFYSTESSDQKSSYIRLALLGQQNETWTVLWGEEGLGTGLDSFRFSTMFGDNITTLIVGYQNTGISDQYVAVYTNKDSPDSFTKVDERICMLYELADFTGSGTDSMMILSLQTQQKSLQVDLLTAEDGNLQPVTSYPIDSLLVACSGLYTSRGEDRCDLVIDGTTTGGSLASEQIYYDAEDKSLKSRSTSLGINLPSLSARTAILLHSRDVLNDGVTEIPIVLGNVQAYQDEQRLMWVSYYDFASMTRFVNNFNQELKIDSGLPSVLPASAKTSSSLSSSVPAASSSGQLPGSTGTSPEAVPSASASASSSGSEEIDSVPEQIEVNHSAVSGTPEESFGLADLSYGYYLSLPIEWKNLVNVVKLGNRSWKLIDLATGATVLTVAITSTDGGSSSSAAGQTANRFIQAAVIGRYHVSILFSDELSTKSVNRIISEFTVLN